MVDEVAEAVAAKTEVASVVVAEAADLAAEEEVTRAVALAAAVEQEADSAVAVAQPEVVSGAEAAQAEDLMRRPCSDVSIPTVME